jgi:cysteine desulfurase family protein
MSAPRIYLDNAATSWPKPEAVYRAVDEFQRHSGAPAGRGAYAEAIETQRRIAQCRTAIASLIGAAGPDRIVFGFNGTDVLNIALHGFLRPGDHVVTSVVEHNSVLRPLRWLAQQRDIAATYVGCDAVGVVDADDIADALQPHTRLIALTHASNVTGAIQPIADVGRIAGEREIVLLVDAAQSLGHVPIDVNALNIGLLAASGHKGLLGPLGTGILYVAPTLESQLESFRQGGTGTNSEQDTQPDDLPHKLEAGNLNVPGIVGLAAGVAYVRERGIREIGEHERQLATALWHGLNQVDGVTLYGPRDPQGRVGVVSLNIDCVEPQETAAMLDSAFGIQVRAGLHCAPLVHRAIGTEKLGGTLRMSIGPFNTDEDIASAIDAVRQLAASAVEMR